MFFHLRYFSVNLNQIENIEWNYAVDNNGKVDTVVCIDLVSHCEAHYLYYNDSEDLKAINELKKLVNYPYSLPDLND